MCIFYYYISFYSPESNTTFGPLFNWNSTTKPTKNPLFNSRQKFINNNKRDVHSMNDGNTIKEIFKIISNNGHKFYLFDSPLRSLIEREYKTEYKHGYKHNI